MRYLAMTMCGVLCGIAGAYLSIAHSAGFVRAMTAARASSRWRADLRQVAAGADAFRPACCSPSPTGADRLQASSCPLCQVRCRPSQALPLPG